MSTRIITPPSMDLNRDMSQNGPDAPPPRIPESGEEGMPVGASEHHGSAAALGCPSPASSPNSGMTPMFPGSMTVGGTEIILSTKIRSVPVPRCLFGPPDPRTGQFAREKVKEIYEQDRKRYNFDFVEEKPLEGRLKWEAVPVAPSTTTSGDYAPKAYALSRLPYISSRSIDRGMVSPPPRTTINNNQLPPTRQVYFEPDREPLLIVRGIEEEREFTRDRSRVSATITSPSSPMKNRPSESSTKRSNATTLSSSTSTVTFVSHRHHQSAPSSHVMDPAVMLIPSPEASSCSSEDSANVEMELGEEEEVATSVDSSSTEEELQLSVLSNATSTTTIVPSSSSSGLSSRICSSASSSSSDSRRTKSVSSASSSPSASPSSPTSSQPPITRYMKVKKRPAPTSTTKAASESAPASAAATEKRAAL